MKKRPLICVPIVENTKEEILSKARELAVLPLDVVEWRVDFFESIGKLNDVVEICQQVKEILGDKKLLFTFRSIMEGGNPLPQGINHHEVYPELLKRVARAKACDYLDVEMYYDKPRVMGVIAVAHENDVDVIGSYHNFESTPITEALISKPLEMYEMMADVAKIAVMPRSKEDVERLLFATEEVKESLPDFPIITMAMGELGKVTRLYGGLYGSSLTFACVGQSSAPGQVELNEVNEVLNRIYGNRHHIVLIGFMGTGKSTVSRELAKKTGRMEIDTDEWIAKNEKKSIPSIFREKGEEAFRQMETDCIDELGGMQDAIISCGGGMAIRELNVKKLQNMGTIVLLTARPETVLDRVKNSGERPLLKDKMNVEAIEELMKARKPYYEKAGQIVIATDGKSPETIADEIIQRLSENNG